MDDQKPNLVLKAFSASAYAVTFRLIAQAISAVSIILLVRTLSEHDYGIYNLLYSIIALMGMVFSFGISNTLQRYLPEYYHRGDFILAHRLFRASSVIRLISNMVVLVVVLYLWETVSPILKIGAYKSYFLLFSFVIVLHMQRGILETCLNAYFLQKYSYASSIVFVVLKAAGYGFALLMHWDLWYVLLIDLLAHLTVIFILEVYYRIHIPRNEGIKTSYTPSEKKRIVRYALFYNFNDAGSAMLDASFDNFIIVMYLNPIAVGAYAFCNRVGKMAMRLLPTNYLIDVIRPLFIAGNNNLDDAQIRRNFILLLKITYFFHFPLFAFFAMFSEDFINILFGGKFNDYSVILIAVAFFNLINAFQMPVGLVAQLRERAEIIFSSKIFSIYNIIADILLIQYFGIWGAVMATGTAVLGKNVFIWYYVRNDACFAGNKLFLVILTVQWGTAVAFWYYFESQMTTNFVRLPVGIALILFCIVFSYRLIRLDEQDKGIILNLISKNRKLRFLSNLKILKRFPIR